MAGRPPRKQGQGRGVLEETLSGIRPLPERAGIALPGRPPSPRPAADRSTEETVGFELVHEGERLEGLAPGIDRAHLRRLRRGEVQPDLTLDLHGLMLMEARQEVRTTLARALAQGKRCVLVIHGRGSHSQQGPVLKRKLVRWLSEPPHGARIMAFATAPQQRGGTGATYVLLRRRR